MIRHASHFRGRRRHSLQGALRMSFKLCRSLLSYSYPPTPLSFEGVAPLWRLLRNPAGKTQRGRKQLLRRLVAPHPCMQLPSGPGFPENRNYLIFRHDFACRTSRLEIMDEKNLRFGIIPSGITSVEADAKGTNDGLEIHTQRERLLFPEVRKIYLLHSFKWSCAHSLTPISIANLWSTLPVCSRFSPVDLTDNTTCLPLGTMTLEREVEGTAQRKVPSWVRIFKATTSQTPKPYLMEMATVSIKPTKSPCSVTRHSQLTRVTGLLMNLPSP